MERKRSDYVLSEPEVKYIASKTYNHSGFLHSDTTQKRVQVGNSEYIIYSDGQSVSVVPEYVDEKQYVSSNWTRSVS